MGILMETIMRKLKQKETKQKVEFYISVLNRLSDERFRPQETDVITNPLSEFKTVAEKRAAYNNALDMHAKAYKEFNKSMDLGTPGAQFNDVEFIGGLWRIQHPFRRKITNVRNREFILGEKLPHQEHTKFDFYKAYLVTTNCYGRFIFKNSSGYDYIVAKYKTSRGTYWAYGKTIADARAFLAISIYDAYQDVIDAVNKKSKTK